MATYKVATDGSGDFTTIAQVNAATFSPGDSVLFRRGDLWRESLSIVGEDRVTYSNYGEGELPHITAFGIISSAWDRYLTTAVFSTTATNVKIVLQDETLLDYITWDTDIATTFPLMSSGTWTFDSVNELLYLWSTDSVDPSGKVIECNIRNHCVSSSSSSDIIIDGLMLSGATLESIRYGFINYPHALNSQTGIIRNNIIKNTSSRGVTINGNNSLVSNNELLHWGSLTGLDAGGIALYGNSNVVQENYFHDSIWGSAIEINSTLLNPYISYENVVRNNLGFNITNQLVEVWVSRNNYVYSNRGYGIGLVGIKITNGSKENVIYNNIIQCNDALGLSVGFSSETVFCSDNKFYNNTIIQEGDSTAAYGLNIRASGHKNNVFKNNLVFTKSSPAMRCLDSDNFFDYNCYFSTTAGSFIVWGIDSYTSSEFSDYQLATGQDLNSISADPKLINGYLLDPTSPAIDAGVDVGVTEDYRGIKRPQGTGYDIGCVEFTTGIQLNGINATGVKFE